MPCNDAMIADVITVKPDQTVGDAMEIFDHDHIRAVPVIDDQGTLVGLFSLNVILTNLLPVSVTMEDGLQRLDFVVGAGPGIAKRLRKLKDRKIAEVMKTDCVVTHPDMALWEAIRLMSKHGSPIPVVAEKTGKLEGIISGQSLLEAMEKTLDEIESE